MKAKTLFRILLVILVVFFSILAMRCIMRPERFKTVYELRHDAIATRLSAIRSIQTVYKNENKKFASSVDELVDFVENGHITIIKNIGEIPEDMTEEQAFKAGLLKKQEVIIPAKNKILELDPNINMKDFQYIPFADKKKFSIDTASISSATYSIPVYRIDVPIDDILVNMDRSIQPENANIFQKLWNKLFYSGLAEETQYKSQYKDMWMGSLTEASTTGSWE
ncbi:MAG: hypothetical protein MJZ76_03065 [Bacteroidales bacterium]|nr:hypothetical protein [Bacteroidales bacterium]